MFACVYFPGDGTLSVIKEQSKSANFETFEKGESCTVRFKGKPWDGTIVYIGDCQAEVNRVMKLMLVNVLNKALDSDPLEHLLAFTIQECPVSEDTDTASIESEHPKESERPKSKGLREPAKVKPARKKLSLNTETPSGNKTGTSLVETWRIINEKGNDFAPSSELVEVLRKLTTPGIQAELKELLQHFETKDDNHYVSMEEKEERTTYTYPQTQATKASTHYQTAANNEFSHLQFLYDNSTYFPSQGQQSQYQDHQHENEVFHSSPYFTAYQARPNLVSETQLSNQIPYTDNQTQSTSNLTQLVTEQNPPGEIPNIHIQTSNTHQQQSQSSQNIQSQSPISEVHITENHLKTPIHTTDASSLTSPLRKSPRKQLTRDPLLDTPSATVILMGDVKIDRKLLRGATQAAIKNEKPGYTLMGKLLAGVFTRMELANSRGLGIVPAKCGDTRPALDQERVKACKEYTMGWCRQHKKGFFDDTDLNAAATEQISYARKKLKRKINT